MSGGHFDYNQSYISYIAEAVTQIKRDIIDNVAESNSLSMLDDKEKFLEVLTNAEKSLNLAYIYAQRLDYYLSGDDSEQTMYHRIEQDIESLEKRNV